METPIAPLGQIIPGYSRQAKRHRWLRWVLVDVACAAIVVAVYFSPWPSRFWAEWVQHLCMNYQAPADAIVFESCPPASHTISGQPLVGDRAGNRGTTEYEVPAWCWKQCLALYNDRLWLPPGEGPDPEPGVIFLHSRQTLSGNARLVHLAVWYRSGGAVRLQLEIFDPNDATKPGIIFFGGGYPTIDFGVSPSTPIILYAGQPDPADPTKFSFAYTAGGLKGEIIGELTKRDSGSIGQPRYDWVQFRWGKGGPLVKED